MPWNYLNISVYILSMITVLRFHNNTNLNSTFATLNFIQRPKVRFWDIWFYCPVHFKSIFTVQIKLFIPDFIRTKD